MWFTKDDDSFRAWFTVADKSGNIRTGGGAGNFTATIVEPTGVTATTATVAEAAGKAGLYTFLIPSSFFATHGVGGYGVVVQVSFTTAPKVTAVFSEVLRVSDEDFDTLGARALLVAYNGAIHIDTKNGAPGAVVGVNGTIDNPVDNIADAYAIATSLNIRRYELIGNITLNTAHDDWAILGRTAESAINFNGQDVADAFFERVQLSGTIGTGPIHANDCDLDGVGNLTGKLHFCGLVSSVAIGIGTTTLHACYSEVPGLSIPSLDMNGATSVNLHAYSGGIELIGMTNAAQRASLEFIAGQAILGPTNTAGTVTLRGVGNITDTSAGITIERNSFLNLDAIWDEVQDGAIAARTIMTRINAMARGRVTLSGGTPKPAQDAVYFDEAGNPIYTNRNTGDERNPL